MTEYRRVRVPGATWFFTVGLAERRGNGLLVESIDTLRSAFRVVRERHPLQMDAVVILPDHLHCVWTLPEGDADYSTRWGLIKAKFSRSLNRGERRSASRVKRGERGIWQRRFWEHCIRDEGDYARHVDDVHWSLLRILCPRHSCIHAQRNPVKHGYVNRLMDWPHSSFHAHVKRGVYAADWGGGEGVALNGAE